MTLGITEDRRENTSQFDLAYVRVSDQKVLTAFDNASTSTLLLHELVEEGKIEFQPTTNKSKINGIGGSARGDLVEVKLHSRNKERSIIITAAIVDKIMIMPSKVEDRYKRVTQLTVDYLNKKQDFGTITENNFQQAPGGKIQMLIGQNVGQDFFPKEIATFDCGLKVFKHRIHLYDEARNLGFSGRFPSGFSPMYSINEHPKVLAIQDNPQQAEHEEDQVFHPVASVPHPK